MSGFQSRYTSRREYFLRTPQWLPLLLDLCVHQLRYPKRAHWDAGEREV